MLAGHAVGGMTERDVLVAGETLIDFLPGSVGPLSAVEQFSRRAGGAPANVAVALSRLGHCPWFWTRVGTDPFGDFLVETLADYGLPERFVERDPDAKTSLAFVSHDETADRQFSFYRDGTADSRMQPDSVSDETLAAVSWVYVGGVPFASEPSRSAMFDLLDRAHDQGCAVVFDPNARPELWSDFSFAETVREVLEHTAVLKATPEDLAAADVGEGSENPLDFAETACGYGPDTTYLTLGSEGAVAYSTEPETGARTASHGGYDVDPVDTTGAGDAFTAGIIAKLVDGGGSLDDVLAFASAVAASTTTGEGAMTSLPTRDELTTFLAEQG